MWNFVEIKKLHQHFSAQICLFYLTFILI